MPAYRDNPFDLSNHSEIDLQNYYDDAPVSTNLQPGGARTEIVPGKYLATICAVLLYSISLFFPTPFPHNNPLTNHSSFSSHPTDSQVHQAHPRPTQAVQGAHSTIYHSPPFQDPQQPTRLTKPWAPITNPGQPIPWTISIHL